ncbi:MAG: DNA polymerase-2 [Candidatus Azotimanducaceae bacterium]|jgi:DNA polymerase-2
MTLRELRHNASMQRSLEGFILSRQWRGRGDGQSLTYWLATDNGPLRVEIEGVESVCFVAAADRALVTPVFTALGGCRMAEVALQTFDHAPVLACYFSSQNQLNAAKARLEGKVVLYEADLRPTDRYLMERFLQAEVRVTGDIEVQDDHLVCRNPVLQPRAFEPSLSVASLDIETSYTENILYSIAISMRAPETEKVFMVGQGASEVSYLEFCADERTLIKRFLDWFSVLDPDVIIGWSVVAFDLDFIQRRCDYYGIKFTLGRTGELISWRTANQGNGRKYALVPGRVVLDGIELLRTATYQFESFSLENVSRELLGRGKLIHDVDARGAEIQNLFAEDKPQLAAYNLEDCSLVHDVFAATNLLDFAIQRSRLTGLDMDRAGGSVAAFDFLYLPRLHRQGYVAPVVMEGSDRGSPGGFVLESEPGIYSDVIVLDFKSLYPSIIRTFNVDPLAMVEGRNESDAIPGFNGAEFSRDKIILPGLIESLWAARDEAKKQKLAAVSQAIKIIMNSFYGVLGTPGCRFFDTRLVSSITLRGHEILQKTRDLIEAKGFRVIYGDTDSVFVLVGEQARFAVDEVGLDLTDYLNRWWRDHLTENYGVQSCLEVEYETHFEKFLMPRVRGSEKGSKKRYAGVVSENGEPQLVFKGLETVRSDWSPVAREFQQTLYRKIFFAEPYRDFILETVASVKTVDLRKLVLRKRVRRNLGDYQKNVPPHVRAARLADQIRSDKGLPKIYQQGGWIEYVMTTQGAEPVAYVSSPIDHDFYVERQLAPVADAILCFLDTSLGQILDKQMALF